jgi:hypothetical protein
VRGSVSARRSRTEELIQISFSCRKPAARRGLAVAYAPLTRQRIPGDLQRVAAGSRPVGPVVGKKT